MFSIRDDHAIYERAYQPAIRVDRTGALDYNGLYGNLVFRGTGNRNVYVIREGTTMTQIRSKVWHTMSEALAYLAQRGHDVSEITLRAQIKLGNINAQKIGNRDDPEYMFDVSELDRFLVKLSGDK